MSRIPDEETIDREEEELLKLLRSKNGTGVSVVNPKRLKDMARAARILKNCAAQAGAKLSYKTNDPFPSMGYIRMTGKHIRFLSHEQFAEAAKLASNVEAYAKADGSVCVDFTFHGLTAAVKEG